MSEMNASDDQARDILARTIWGEARGEPLKGMQAIANVVLNRVAIADGNGGHYWWGHDIVTVCLKPWQFSCWNKNDPNRKKLEKLSADKDRSFQLCLQIAEKAVSGCLLDVTGGADHYHTRYINPFWAKNEVPTTTIGDHLFYKLYP